MPEVKLTTVVVFPFTVRVVVAEALSVVAQLFPVPPVPVAVTVKAADVPSGVVPLVVSVNVEVGALDDAVPVNEVGMKLALVPVGRLVALRTTVQLPFPLKFPVTK